jgi:uncharacterized membrane protein
VSKVQGSVDVDVPVRAAYRQWTRYEDFPLFMVGIEEVTRIDDRHLHWRINLGGMHREFDTETLAELLDSLVSWRTVAGDPQQRGMVTFRRLDEDRTRVDVTMHVEPHGLTERAGTALGILDVRLRNDLLQFKDFIEERVHGHRHAG